MKTQEDPTGVNLLDLKPSRTFEWETEDDEKVVVLVPKFRNRFLVTWFLPRLRSRYFRVKLDAFGSYVWLNCDGSKTVNEIGQNLKKRFGNSVEPVYDRLALFVKRLERERFIRFTQNNKTMKVS